MGIRADADAVKEQDAVRQVVSFLVGELPPELLAEEPAEFFHPLGAGNREGGAFGLDGHGLRVRGGAAFSASMCAAHPALPALGIGGRMGS